MKRLLQSGLAVAFVAGASVAHAQQTTTPAPAPAPAEATSAEDEEANDDIIVLAEPGDQVRIDRRTYTLRDDATAQSTNMYEVLGRIPSVSVAPSGEITLLGASNVTIQINGQPVQGQNLEQVLRGIPGGNVERIEVITNPSAQYASDTSGGIINIITRQRFDAGFNGSIRTDWDSLGGYHVGVTPSYSHGRWAFSAQAGVYGGEGENVLARERQTPPGGQSEFEDGLRNFEYEGWYLSQLQAAYSPTERRRMSLTFDGGQNSFQQRQSSALSDSGGPISESNLLIDNNSDYANLTFDFQQQGDAPRELVKFNAVINAYTNDIDSTFDLTPDGGATGAYLTSQEQDVTTFSSDLDVEQPFGEVNFLTFGAAFDQVEQTTDSTLTPISGVTPPAFASRLDGTAQTLAAYATYQFGVDDWTVLPGLRVEGYRREVASGGLETDDTDVRAFPSIHVRNELTPRINVDLSYSSRIQRPGFEQLDPAQRFVDVNRAFAGNPNLDPTTTDAYEANLTYQHAGSSFSFTFFDRISDDVMSRLTDIDPDGVILTMPVNAGTSEQRGVQAVLRAPLNDRWRYSLSGNVLSREFDFLSGGILTRREELEYDGLAQLDYRDEDQDEVGADQLQFEVRFQGPRHGLQTDIDPFVMANFTWRRRIAPKLQAIFSVQDIFDSVDQVTEVTTDDYFERTEFESQGTRFRLALTYEFGSGPRRPMSDQPPGGPPVPSF